MLERVRRDASLALHGVSLSLGGHDPWEPTALDALRRMVLELQPEVVSDHLCFGSVGGHRAHDLWPLPHTEQAVAHVAERIDAVQTRLGRRIAIENVSSYLRYRDDEMTEWAFLSQVAARADCHILLDLNNIVVNAKNHGFDADDYLSELPFERIVQLHLAGHSDHGSYAIDDHGSAVPDAVWRLYARFVSRVGPRPTVIEWDQNLPSLEALREESARARRLEQQTLLAEPAPPGAPRPAPARLT